MIRADVTVDGSLFAAVSRSLGHAEAEQAGLQSELACWRQALKHNREKCMRRQQERADLVYTHQQIASFAATVVCLCTDFTGFVLFVSTTVGHDLLLPV